MTILDFNPPYWRTVFSYQIELPFVSGIFQPYASLMPASIQPAARSPRARAKWKRAKVDSPRCVDSKLALFHKAPEGTGSKNTVCLPSLKPNTILKFRTSKGS